MNNNVVPVSREELKSLRTLTREWERIALTHESELTTLRSFRTRAFSLYRRLYSAKDDPVALGRVIEEVERELVSE